MIIRPFRKDDATTVVSWVKDRETLDNWAADHFNKYPVDAEDLLLYYEQQSLEYPNTVYLVACDDMWKPVGHLFLSVASDDLKHPRMRFIIIDPSQRGKGYGRMMVNMASEYAFEYLNIEDISLGVFSGNISACECYKGAGFRMVEKRTRVVNREKVICIEMKRDKHVI